MEALEALEDDSVEFKTFGGKLKNQQWKKNDVGDGYFTLENDEAGKFLTATADDLEIVSKSTLVILEQINAGELCLPQCRSLRLRSLFRFW